MPTTDEEQIVGILTGVADVFEKKLSDLTISAYLEVLGGYNPKVVGASCRLCISELGFMPRPVEIINRIKRIENDAYHRALRDRPPLPEPPASEEQLRWSQVMAKSLAGWVRSSFVKKQEDAGTFFSYEQSTIDYMTEQGVDEKDINRFRNACSDVNPREER